MKKKLIILLILIIMIIVVIAIRIYKKTNKYSKIEVIYGYENFMAVEYLGRMKTLNINVIGEKAMSLKNLIEKYDIENSKNEDKGHLRILATGDCLVKFYDGSKMSIDTNNYSIQYKNGGRFYNLSNVPELTNAVKEIVKIELNKKETENINTNKITITPESTKASIEIKDQKLISKLLNEYKYVDSNLSKEDIKEMKDEFQEDSERNGELSRFEVEYTVDFNNGLILRIYPNSDIHASVVENNGRIKKNIQIYGKFIHMINNIYTDYNKTNKLFEAEKIYIKHNGITKKIQNDKKEYLMDELIKQWITPMEYWNYEIDNDFADYTLIINENKVILDESESSMIIVYRDGKVKKIIRNKVLEDYIKSLF